MTTREKYIKTLQSPSLIAKYGEKLGDDKVRMAMTIAYSTKSITFDELSNSNNEAVTNLNNDTPPQGINVADDGSQSEPQPMMIVDVADELIFDSVTGNLHLEFITDNF